MAVPKRRTSHSRQGTRRSHHWIRPRENRYCPQCGEPILPHRVCASCGYYKGREVILMDEKDEGK